MKSDLEKALNHVSKSVQDYRKCNLQDGDTLLKILQQITATLHFLESERAKYHNQFQTIINTLVLEGKSVARAENQANIDVPEMYMIRHIMSSAYEVVGAIRTTVSYLKHERNSTT